MYIATVPNRHSPPAILLRESFREGGKVRTRTLANLTSWAPERIEALRRTLKGEFDGLIRGPGAHLRPDLCRPVRAETTRRSPGACRACSARSVSAKLALFLVLARIAAQGSRLSAVRWADQHAVAETLGLGRFDEDDLYEALDALALRQEHIEDALYRVARQQMGRSPTVVLYDVTSSYFEGECNELAAFGYNRDKKPSKAQIVIGLVTTGRWRAFGRPSVRRATWRIRSPCLHKSRAPHPFSHHGGGVCWGPGDGQDEREGGAGRGGL